jgi:hypothetical protein
MNLVEAARRYIGQKELTGNVFKDDTELGKKLHAAGQVDGNAWCALFGEVCLKDSDPSNFKVYDKLCSASAVQTFTNFVAAGFKELLIPEVGTIVVWQRYVKGKKQWQGHLGIVSEKLENGRSFKSIEGNTNSAGGREGIEVAELFHYVNYSTQTGLRLLGFIKV